MSHINLLVTAMVAKLNEAPPVCSEVGRVRLRPLSKESALAVVVRPMQSEVGEVSLMPSQPASWITAVAVEVYARSGTATPPDAAVDGLMDLVFERLMADTTLGGAVRYLKPEKIEFDFDIDGEQTSCATLQFSAQHASLGLTLS
jgi:hypothetical protein